MNREEWLTKASEMIRPLIEASLAEGTQSKWPDKLAVSCGWPNSSPRKVIGQCSPTIRGNGVVNVFISPKLADPLEVLEVLTHELIHAVDDCRSGHKGEFRRIALAVGLEGKMTSTNAGEALRATLTAFISDLGDYPHEAVLMPEKSAQPGSRMKKLVCQCGVVIRTTMKWIDLHNEWICPCGDKLEVEY